MTILQMLFAGGPSTITLNITSSTNNYNLFTAAGSPSAKGDYVVNISSGVTIGATAGNTAFTVGQFPTGTTITINNSGSIAGYGGTGGVSTVGGSGGDAINANYANQTVIINNLSGATIYGGGGGGGKGGTGGTGGTGGGGSYTSINYQSSYPAYQWAVYLTKVGTPSSSAGIWGGGYVFSGASGYATQVGNYYRGSFVRYEGGGYNRYQIGQGTTINTNGGTGGAGGAGGNGGRGLGSDGAATNGSTGSTGSAGSAGGTNAGAGGTGGTGGTGGNGSTWGTAGLTGATGSTGATGANGNRTAGSAGATGSAGSSGGAAGRYLVKGSNSVTLNNSGTVAGGLA